MARKEMLIEWCRKEGYFGKRLLAEWTGICENGENINIERVIHVAQIKHVSIEKDGM